jgi:hypothetical protein
LHSCLQVSNRGFFQLKWFDTKAISGSILAGLILRSICLTSRCTYGSDASTENCPTERSAIHSSLLYSWNERSSFPTQKSCSETLLTGLGMAVATPQKKPHPNLSQTGWDVAKKLQKPRTIRTESTTETAVRD